MTHLKHWLMEDVMNSCCLPWPNDEVRVDLCDYFTLAGSVNEC